MPPAEGVVCRAVCWPHCVSTEHKSESAQWVSSHRFIRRAQHPTDQTSPRRLDEFSVNAHDFRLRHATVPVEVAVFGTSKLCAAHSPSRHLLYRYLAKRCATTVHNFVLCITLLMKSSLHHRLALKRCHRDLFAACAGHLDSPSRLPSRRFDGN